MNYQDEQILLVYQQVSPFSRYKPVCHSHRCKTLNAFLLQQSRLRPVLTCGCTTQHERRSMAWAVKTSTANSKGRGDQRGIGREEGRDETGRCTIEAFIKRFREQPPAPPEERYVPQNVEFWWHNQEDTHDSSELFSPLSSRSSNSGRRGERYGRKYENDDSEEELEQNDQGQTNFSDSGLFDFEKRTENLMMKCDNLLSEIDPPSNDEKIEPVELVQAQAETNVAASEEEFAPWVSIDIPSEIAQPSNNHFEILSPIKSASPPPIEDRNSPDSIDGEQRPSAEVGYEEVSEEESVSDTESDISDLENTSVETTNELIKRAEQLLHGYCGGGSSGPPEPFDFHQTSLSSEALLIPASPVDLPAPEIPPVRPDFEPIQKTDITIPQPEQHISPSRFEIGVQTDFQSFETPINSSIISSTTSLFISPASTPRDSPIPPSDFPLEDTVNLSPHHSAPMNDDSVTIDNPRALAPVPPSSVEETLSQSTPLPDVSPSQLPPKFSENPLNLTYEEVEPYLKDEIVSKLWKRLVIVREQMKRGKKIPNR